MNRALRSLLFSLLLSGCTAASAATIEATETDNCLRCHASNDTPISRAAPQLSGLKSPYILRQLIAFQQGERGDSSAPAREMATAIRPYQPQQLEALAHWAADQQGEKRFDHTRAQSEPGAVLFAEQCRGCHQSFMGRLMTGSPRLDYLSSSYINRQLQLFADGKRQIADANKHQLKMIMVVKALSSEQLVELKAFITAATTAP